MIGTYNRYSALNEKNRYMQHFIFMVFKKHQLHHQFNKSNFSIFLLKKLPVTTEHRIWNKHTYEKYFKHKLHHSKSKTNTRAIQRL